MKYALISDIHANPPALEAVLGDIERRSDVDATYHPGDLVGYAPWPKEVVELLRQRGIAGIAGIAGNYDSTTRLQALRLQVREPGAGNPLHQSYEWTRAHATPETKRDLAGLPFRLDLWPKGGISPAGRA